MREREIQGEVLVRWEVFWELVCEFVDDLLT